LRRSDRSNRTGQAASIASLLLVALFASHVGGDASFVSAQWKQEVAPSAHPNARWKSLSLYFDKPALGDLTGDGVPEIIGTSIFGGVFCIDGATGRVLWAFEDEHSFEVAIYICPAIVDVDCDGTADVISVTPKGLVICLDGRNGRKLWSYQADGPTVCSPTAFDLNRDGRPETAVADATGNVHLLDKSGKLIWKSAEDAPYYGAPAMGLIDGQPVVILSDRKGVLRSLDGASGKILWTSVPAKGPISTSPLVFRDEKDAANPWKALIGTDLGGLILINPKNGSAIWNRSLAEGEAIGEFALGDVNGDGREECVFSTSGSRIVAISPVDGKEIWSRKLKIPFKLNPTVADLRRIRSDVLSGEPVLTDVDGDGQPDVIIDIRGSNNYIYALRGRDAKILWSWGNRNLLVNQAPGESVVVGGGSEAFPSTASSSSVPIFSQATPAVADFDSDGMADLIFNDRDEIGLVSIPLSVPLKAGTWPKYAGSPCNNNIHLSLPCLATPTAPELSLSVEPVEVFKGDPARLCWKSTGADNVEIDHGIGLVGSDACSEITPDQTSVWHARARGCSGEVRREITLAVKVRPAAPVAPPSPVPRKPPVAAPTPVLKGVTFEEGSYLITEDARKVLSQNAALLRQAAGFRIAVEAGCDERDSMAYCHYLAFARAEAVREYLAGLGVDDSRIEPRPAGVGSRWEGVRSSGNRLYRAARFEVTNEENPPPRQ